MMVQVQLVFDSETDQLVVRIPAAEGEGDVELLRMDVRQLDASAKRRLRDVRDPDRPQAAPGQTVVTRR